MEAIRLLLCYLIFSVAYHSISSETDPIDGKLRYFSRLENSGKILLQAGVRQLILVELPGKVSPAATRGHLSFNRKLSGLLTPQIGDLKKLETLILQHCSFIGWIPRSLGNLAELSFLSLSGNNFTGYIPVSTHFLPGLDLLHNLKQLILSRNKLSGKIPEKLFRSNMALTQVLLDENELTGEIPSTLGLVRTLQSLHLGGNSLNGSVPSNINYLTNLLGLSLRNNAFNGKLGFDRNINHQIQSIDLGNNRISSISIDSEFNTLLLQKRQVSVGLSNNLQNLEKLQQSFQNPPISFGGSSCTAASYKASRYWLITSSSILKKSMF
nr:probable leucine-rich repeat receptor-like protein kinase At5g49770 [Coffea arabica]